MGKTPQIHLIATLKRLAGARRLRQGYAYATASALAGAIMLTGSKAVLGSLSPLALASMVFPLATLALAIWLGLESNWRFVRPLRMEAWKWIGAVSAFYIGSTWAFWAALALLPPSVHSLLNRMQVIPTVLLGVWLLHERFGRREAAGALLLVMGVLLVRPAGGVEMGRGFALLLMSSCGFAAAEVVAKRAVAVVDPLVLTIGRNAAASVVFLTLAFVRGELGPLSEAPHLWLLLIVVALAGPAVSRVFYYRALQSIEVSKAALVGQTEPLWVSLLSIAFLGYRLGWREWIGGAVIFAGCALLVWRWSPPRFAQRASASRDFAVRQWRHHVAKWR